MAQRLANDILDPSLDDMGAPPKSLRQEATAGKSSSSVLGELDYSDFHLAYAKNRVHHVLMRNVTWVENLVQKLSDFVYLFDPEEEARVKSFVAKWEEREEDNGKGKGDFLRKFAR